MDSKIRYGALSVFVLMAAWFTFSLVKLTSHTIAAERWPHAEGQILSTSVVGTRTMVGLYYAPAIEYSYSIGGEKFRSRQIRFDSPKMLELSEADEWVESYPVGRKISVAYDPASPSRSVLQTNLPSYLWQDVATAVCFWAFVLFLFYDIRHPEWRQVFRTQESLAAGND